MFFFCCIFFLFGWGFFVCLLLFFLVCFMSEQQVNCISDPIGLDNCMCRHTEQEAADQTCLTYSQYTDTGPTSLSTRYVSK